MLHSEKLRLPTVETCRWRETASDNRARCRLISRLTGMASAAMSMVGSDVCEACCRSFPPSPSKLNPVVASVLYQVASDLVAAGGSRECSEAQARRLLQLADRSLDFSVPDLFRVTPARTSEVCYSQGEPIHRANAPAASGEPEYVCRHSAHEMATLSICRLCRDWTAEKAISRKMSLTELVPPPATRYGQRVSDWAVGVTTSPRRGPTLELCLDSLARAGWQEPRLFLDGTSPLPRRYDHLPLTWHEEAIGALPTWYFALVELVLQQPQAGAYLLLQDDVCFYDRESLRTYLEAALWPGERAGLVTLFYTGLDCDAGWHPWRGGWHWGAQAFIFAPETARRIASDGEFARLCVSAAGGRHVAIPEALLNWVRQTGTEMWYVNPSLTQHIGNTSTIWMNSGNSDGRRAPWFAGAIETAFSLEAPLSSFPEDVFQSPTALEDAYQSRIERGRQRMRERAVVICGLCRDVRHYLPRMAARIERLGGMFADWQAILYENDSSDATLEFLLDWQTANPRVEVITESLGVPRFPQARSPQRAQWLAWCRNRCRSRALEKCPRFSDVIVLDMDLAGGFSFDGLAHTFGDDDWDFVGAYGLEQRLDAELDDRVWKHVDVWAFRPIAGSPATRLKHYNQLTLGRGEPLLPVESCFGGLGVYRMKCYEAAEYGGGDCEHVVLHERQRRAGFGRQFLNPSQITIYTPF